MVEKSYNSYIRAVLDTNIFVRATLSRTGGSALIVNAWRRKKAFRIVTCRAQVNEILRVLAYPRIRDKYGITPQEAYKIPKFLYKRTIWVNPKGDVRLCRDDTDDFILETSIIGKADYLVSMDHDFLQDMKLKQQMLNLDVQVVDVGDFIEVLRIRGLVEP